ncbi:amidophosphoribosyltransferase [Candidatus Bathyarchaeota archaeon]|nr:MAG: amidophosphoribosyltransferase [Candidatus Bathyarchaeota archaeon]
MCGVVGVYCSNPSITSKLVYYALFSLQHRGQESAGIAASTDKYLTYKKGMGLVTEVFDESDFSYLRGNVAVGHVRYSTTGLSKIENSQPFVVKSKAGYIAVCHNGNLVNYAELRRELENEGSVFTSDSDTEVISQLMSRFLMKKDTVESLEMLNRKLVGSYSLTMLINDTLIGYRDPLGFKPLCVGELEDGYVICSESCAIDALGGKFIKDVEPGEAVIIKNGELEFIDVSKPKRRAFCIFEYIYFARPDSVIDGVSVYEARIEMGKILSVESPVTADFVSAVPDSGITAAIGFSQHSGIPYKEALIKNRYVGRTFIMPEQSLRELSVRLKVNVIKQNVAGKRIILVDDSIVRGTTSRRIVDMLRSCGAREVHVRIGSPPIIAPCYFGIDMKTREELIAANNSVEEIRKLLNADSLAYLTLKGLLTAIKNAGGENGYCLACLTARYPVEVPGEVCELEPWEPD